jgi:hypothetical protein
VSSSSSTPSSPPGSGAIPPTVAESPYIRLSSLSKKKSSSPPPPLPIDAYQKKESSSSSGSGSGGIKRIIGTPGNLSNNATSISGSGSLSLPLTSHQQQQHHDTSLLSFPTTITTSSTDQQDGNSNSANSNPFVVTVRNSNKSVGGLGNFRPTGKSASGSGGPRLALYRSNSSLDLLDRDNYLIHHPHHSHLHQQRLKLAEQVRGQQSQQQNNRASIGEVVNQQQLLHHSHAHQEKGVSGGCFPRRKDFGSHGSIDVLSVGSGGVNSGHFHHHPNHLHLVHGHQNAGPLPAPTAGYKPERSGSVGNASTFLSLLGSRDVTSSKKEESSSKNNKEMSTAAANTSTTGMEKAKTGLRESASPRLRLKLQKLWEHKDPGGSSSSSSNSNNKQQQQQAAVGTNASSSSSLGSTTNNTATATATISSSIKEKEGLFRKLRGSSSNASSRNANAKSLPEVVKFEVFDEDSEGYGKVQLRHGGGSSSLSSGGSAERFRRRVLAHYDCQSVSANICDAAKLRGLLSRRRNTTTGASAASLAQRPHSTTSALVAAANNGLSASSNNSNNSNSGCSSSNNGGGGQQPSSLLAETFSSSGSTTPDQDHGDDKSNALVLR